MSPRLVVGLIVISLDGDLFQRTAHALDLAVGPWMVGLSPPVRRRCVAEVEEQWGRCVSTFQNKSIGTWRRLIFDARGIERHLLLYFKLAGTLVAALTLGTKAIWGMSACLRRFPISHRGLIQVMLRHEDA